MLIKNFLRTIGSMTVAAVLLSQSSLGQDQWINNFGGFYHHPFNWLDTTAPGPSDIAVFGIDDEYVVTWTNTTGNTVCKDVYVPEGDVTFRSGDASRWTHQVTNLLILNGDSSLSLGAGDATALNLNVDGQISISGSGVMNITSASNVFTPTATIGDTVDEGSLNVMGQSSGLSSDSITIGKGTPSSDVSGSINLQDGAIVISNLTKIGDWATGTVAIGSQSNWFNFGYYNVGSHGTGGLFISDGGGLDTEFLGVGHLGTGYANVIGEGSRIRATLGMWVGYRGNGVLEIRDSGGVETKYLDLGSIHGRGTVNVNGSRTSLDVNDTLAVGVVNAGTLNVLNGGRVDALETVIGIENGNGSVLVRGPESYLSTNYLDVGADGTGSLTIEDSASVINQFGIMRIGTSPQAGERGEVTLSNGACLNSYDGLRIGSRPNSHGTLTLFDSVLTVGGDVEVAGTATMANGGVGVIDLVGSTADIGGTLKIWDTGNVTLRAFGPFLHANSIDNSTGGEFDFQFGELEVENFVGDLVNQGGCLARGQYVSGDETDLAASDNADLSLRRLDSDIQSRTEFEVKSTSPIATPTSFEFTLEGAVFARSNVVQTIELFDYVAADWELVDTRNAVRSPTPDSVVTVAATGDLSRFVEPGTMCIESRVRYQSDIPRQNFASNTDQTVWTIE